MELREYMSVRRAYNLVRQALSPEDRITFEEYAILCRLDSMAKPVKTSAIAEYQGALRPTMTHRTNHLVSLGLIERGEGNVDRRNVVCSITERGKDYVYRLSQLICDNIPAGQPLSRTNAARIMRYGDAMGAVFVKAGDLILLCIHTSKSGVCTITELVEELGFLQPTVSMSVSALDGSGLIERRRDGSRTVGLVLTPAGTERARDVASKIANIVVHRKPRTKDTKS